MKIVKFSNGKYGVRVGNWFKGYKFLDVSLYVWTLGEYVAKHAQYKTKEEALEVYFRKDTQIYFWYFLCH